jgi:hypothetical protein
MGMIFAVLLSQCHVYSVYDQFAQNNSALEPILCLLSISCVIIVVSVHDVMSCFGTENH